MNDPIERGVEATKLGPVNESDVEAAITGGMNLDDVQNTSGSFIPDASLEIKPRIGMEFASLEDAYNFYNSYARHCGFSIRKDQIRKIKTGAVSRRMLRCSKAGMRDKKFLDLVNRKHKARSITRCSCPARISVNLKMENNTYWITQFVETHNHALCCPTKTHWLRSHKRVTEDHLNMIASFKGSDIGVVRSIDFITTELGGHSQLSYSEMNVRNALRRKRQGRYDTDADTLLGFLLMKSKDSQFTYEIQIDDNMRFTSCFWVDKQSKDDYMAFSDVVCFDTTYKTNEYAMQFGPFVGVNHHMQIVSFGAGLLFDEMVVDFKWLFQTWLDAICGVHPKTIITGQDATIEQAVAKVFPNTRHILCLWHINKKLLEKLSHISHKYPTFKVVWDNCLHGSKSRQEYESSWSMMIEEFNLHDNSWLQHMYDIRHMWVPAFTKKMFSAGMRTTGRSETVNSMFDGFVNHKYSLIDFANGYQKAVSRKREDEENADSETSNVMPVLKTKWGIEAQMAGVYTFKVFLTFQKEVEKSMYYIAKLITNESVMEQWQVYKFEQTDERKRKTISWSVDEMIASCSCMKFEFCGIVCRHIITFFRFKHIISMPRKHVLTRWIRTAKNQTKQPCNSSARNIEHSLVGRNHALSQSLSFLRHEALTNPAAYEIVKEFLDRATAAVLELPKNETVRDAINGEAGIKGQPTAGAGGVI